MVLPATVALVLAASATARTAPAPPSAARPARASAAPAAPADTSTRKAVVIEGDDHLFMVSAPHGWVLDDTAGMGSRIRCVLYPQGQAWATAATVMYVNPLHGYGARTRTVSTLIAEDEKSFLKKAPRGRVSEGGTFRTASGKTARVRYFAADGGAPSEAVAYVSEKDLVMLLVLSSRTPQGFRQSLPAYRNMVESYAWVGSNLEFGLKR